MARLNFAILSSCCVVACFPHRAQPLSSSAATKVPRPIKRVAIIGSAISGLGVAHALDSLSDDSDKIELSLFDARSKLNTQDGAGIQLNGGLVAIGMFNKSLQKEVMEAGIPLKEVEGRAKAWQDPSPSTYSTLLKLDLEKIVRNTGGEGSALVQDDKLLWYAIQRGALQQVLLEQLPQHIVDKVLFEKRLSNIVTGNSGEGGGVFCDFADGSKYGPFDMVIGCDGVRSAVKDFIEKGRVASGDTGLYSGIRIKFAVEDGDPAAERATTSKLTQYFGDGGFALSGVYGAGKDKPPATCSYLITLDEGYFGPFKRKSNQATTSVDENVEWKQDAAVDLEERRTNMIEQVKALNIPDFQISPSVSKADRLFEVGVYIHNPFTLKGWSKELSDGSWAVLVGDAAHAMPPFLGQGANQALQDAYTLATKVCEYNDIVQGRKGAVEGDLDDKTLKELLKEYESKRWLPTTSITLKSSLIGYLEVGGFEGAYSKFRDTLFRFLGSVGIANRVLLDAATPKL